MTRKKKQENRLNIILLLFFTVVFIVAGVFIWVHRYEVFPQLIKNGVDVHFLSKNGEDKIVRYNYDNVSGDSRFKFAIVKLLEGPSSFQKVMNTYSEIPVETKIIAIIEESDKNIIDLNSGFNTGGGTESIYNKLYQLIRTVEANTEKPTYLFIEGKQVEVFGGEGIMITQPLSKDSL